MIYINLLIIFLLIIFIHEFGHYLSARLFKAEVTDFSIGFGKPIYQFTDKNKTTYTSYEVDEINRNLETRLSVLKVLESILRIIYGSEY